MTKNDDGSIASEVSDRLDDLFSEDDFSETHSTAPAQRPKSEADVPKTKTDRSAGTKTGISELENSPVKELKSVVLSMDWEITDKIIESYIEEVTKLKKQYKNDKLVISFLQIHEIVGKYIKKKKANALPDSIKLLHSSFAGLEKILTPDDLSDAEKKKILGTEIKKLKNLKQQLQGNKKPGKAAPSGAAAASFDQNVLNKAMEELKDLIKSEFAALREEIRSMNQK